MTYVVLALKWRPQTFDEVAGQEAIGRTLKNAIDQGRTAHAYLFTGPRGVGKTSTARILAKALNCEKGPTSIPDNTCESCREITTGRSLDVLEIDGASNRGIDDIRELRESVRYAPAVGRMKVYIIDEVHMLTTDAFNALLKTLEEPPSHVVFVLATTEPLKVPATIVSRCQRFDFSRLRMRDTLGRLQTICAAEKVEITDDGLSLIARRAEGSMRDALTLLDQVIASGRTPLNGASVAAAIGISGRDLYFEISEAMLAQDPHQALALLTRAYNDGQNLQEVAEEMVAHIRNILVLTEGDDLAGLVDATDAERDRYRAQAQRTKAPDLLRQLHIAIEAAAKMRRSAFPRVILEVALAEICLLPRSIDLANLVRELSAEAPVAGDPPPLRIPSPASPAPSRILSSPPSRIPSPAPSRTPSSPPDPTPPAPPRGGHARSRGDFIPPRRESAPQRGDAPPPAGESSAPLGALEAPAGDVQTAVEGASSSGSPASDDPWSSVVHLVRAKRPALAATLKDTQIAGEQDGYLMIRLPEGAGPFTKSTIESAESRPVLQAAIKNVYGRSLGWKIDGAAATPAVTVGTEPANGGGGRKGADSSPGAGPARGGGSANGARSNLADIERIAKKLNGDVVGPS